ncbi:Protein tyrosine kinase Protein kinase domain [Trypanosoma vivax]|uniref:non-specific serine/threonine protein kinase n=1 Tax=Trypanosoma vivax (strain Y486) TaxID=1055687 RepID=G0TSX7_TRYVY|nr:putative serine/threonine-protein kinase Nek1 [Trypanosoma vivax]KAH8605389.1 Protein tyrosine kinase Protein kinase domain [Trypanosoma vivax]CCC47057.1 putative serine/threonine-protein kinase Nek1 [Trypanosoma vivax Y486]
MQPRDKSAPGLERYIIGKPLGYGSTGDVFVVRDAASGKSYVLKQMSLVGMTVEGQKRAMQEILVMNGVDHPNIIKFRESFSSSTSINIVMEHCKCTLEELIEMQQKEGQPFPEEVIIEWMAELLCGLAYLHSRGIVHRDIKTSNIFVTEKNHVKLGDFGACTLLASTAVEPGTVVGTPLYFSPEVCEGEAYDVRSDVWSLGVVFYETCTLRRPFNAEHLPGLLQQITTQDVEPFNTGLDPRFEGIVMRMLRKNPRKRPTAQELIDKHLVVPQSHPSHPTQKPSRGRLIQQRYGPELFFDCQTAAEQQNGQKPEEGRRGAVSNGEKVAQVKALQLPLRTPRHFGAPVGSARRSLSKTAGNGNEKGTARAGKDKGLSTQERMEAMRRIRCAKSKINMVELRQNMQQRRIELLGEEAVSATDGVPVVIELQTGVRDIRSAEVNQEDDAAAVAGHSNRAFLDDVAAVIERHTLGGKIIDLSELEDAVSLLSQYKVSNYGLY